MLPFCLASLAMGGVPAYHKVLFVGDSITSHGPKDTLGWSLNCGMAASAIEKDYVHLLLGKLTAAQKGVAPESMVVAEGGGKLTDKLQFVGRFKAYQADLAIVQMGENDNADVSETGFQQPYEQIVNAIREGNPKATILCCGVWSPPSGNRIKDGMIRAVCDKFQAQFVDLAEANRDPANKAAAEAGRFTHPGVNWHPGDKGMQAYADALWQTLQNPAAAPVGGSAPKDEKPFAMEEAWDGAGVFAWNNRPVIVEQNGKKLVQLTSPTAAGAINLRAALPLEKCKGKKLVISTRVRGENVSEKPLPYNGVKLMLATTNAEGFKNYPQAPLPTGSFDWKEVRWEVSIADNLIEANLVLGLEQVSGTVWFDKVKITEL